MTERGDSDFALPGDAPLEEPQIEDSPANQRARCGKISFPLNCIQAASAGKRGKRAMIQPNVPPLRSGDRLTRDEFERRYEAAPHIKKAELIDGVVRMSAAVRWGRHGRPQARLIAWLVGYEAETEGVAAGDNATTRLDLNNQPQPDAVLLIEPASGGQSIISADDYVERAPELVAEISGGPGEFDLQSKLQLYLRAGVLEFIVWRVAQKQIDWFVRSGDQFQSLTADEHGCLRSEAFPGLWLDVDAFVRGDLKKLFKVLQQGLATAEHGAFVERLKSARGE
jgi:Uma2 family endonuclease